MRRHSPLIGENREIGGIIATLSYQAAKWRALIGRACWHRRQGGMYGEMAFSRTPGARTAMGNFGDPVANCEGKFIA